MVTGSLLSGAGVAQGCLYQKYQSGIDGFSEPSSDPYSLTQTRFLESREMTMGSAGIIAGLFGLTWLFHQYKANQKVSQEQPIEAANEPETVVEDKPVEVAQEPETVAEQQENEHPEAPGGELDVQPENNDEVVNEAEQTQAEATETEEKQDVAAVV